MDKIQYNIVNLDIKFKRESGRCGYFQRVKVLLLLKKETSDFYGKGTTFLCLLWNFSNSFSLFECIVYSVYSSTVSLAFLNRPYFVWKEL